MPRGGLSPLAAGRVAGTGQGGPRRPGGGGGAGGEGPEVTEALGPPDGALREGLASNVHACGTCVPGKVLVVRKVVVHLLSRV